MILNNNNLSITHNKLIIFNFKLILIIILFIKKIFYQLYLSHHLQTFINFSLFSHHLSLYPNNLTFQILFSKIYLNSLS